MATVLQSPGAIELSGNIKDFIIDSSVAIPFQVKIGSEVILTESYEPNSDNRVIIRLKDIIPSLLKLNFPTSDVFEQTESVKIFTFVVDGASSDHTIIKGGVDADITTDTFLKANWLTWQPQQKYVKFNAPEWLTYYASVACNVKVKAYYKDDDPAPATITLTALTAGKLYTLNMSYGYLSGLFTGQPVYFDVWVEDAVPTVLSFVQRFVLSADYYDHDDFFVFENSLGGFDCVRFTGEKEETNSFDIESALFDEDTTDFDVDFERIFKKDTGFFADERHRVWANEFFNSLQKYFCADSGYQSITVSKPKAKAVEGELSSYSFQFALSKQTKLLNLSRADELPDVIEIVDPADTLFFLAPRLSEFTTATLSNELLLPIQVPFAESWQKTSYGAIESKILGKVTALGYVSGGEVEGLVDLSPYAKLSGGNSFSGVQTFNNGIVVNGDIIQNGDPYETHAEHLNVENNLMQLNVGEPGSQITGVIPGTAIAFSGIEINRGSADPYYMGIVEGANPLIKLGKKDSLVTVMAREDAPADAYPFVWDDATKRAKTVASVPDSLKLGNRIAADYWHLANSNLITVDWQTKDLKYKGDFTTDTFAQGMVGGVGAKIDQQGHSEMQSLTLREFLRTPELIKNQVRVAGNQFWFTDSGIVESVSGSGPYTITLKVEAGDGVNFRDDDILIGIYNHDNGFETCYLDVVSVDFENNTAVVNSRNGIAPRAFMQLARLGNETDTDRQTSVFVDGLEGYLRVLGDVSDHTTNFNNIVAQLGCLNLTSPVFGLMEKGLYVKDFGYFENVRVSGDIIVTGGNAETLDGAQAKADSAETNATAVANTAQATADSKTDAWVTQITQDTVTAEFMRTLSLEVGDHIQMGAGAVISWGQISDSNEIGNLISNSNDFTINYYFYNGSIASVSQADPFWGENATLLNLTDVSSDLYRSVTGLVPNTVYTISLYVKLNTASNFVITTNNGYAWNTITDSQRVITASGWQKISYNVKTDSNGAFNIHLGASSEGVQQLPGSIYVFGLRLEVSSGFDIGTITAVAETKANAAEANATAVANTAQAAADTAQATADSKTNAWVTQITQDTVTAEYMRTLNLEVGDHIQMGSGAVISWGQISDSNEIGNLISFSNDFTINYSFFNGSVASVSQADPFGGENATLLNLTDVSHDLYRRVTGLVPNTVYTISLYVKLNTASNFVITTNNGYAWNTITDSQRVITASGWQKISYNVKTDSNGAFNIHLGASSEGVQQLPGSVYVFGLRLEVSSGIHLSTVTQITNDTIRTTDVVATNLQVQAANITGQLTAGQINFDNAVGNDVTLTGHIEADTGYIGGFDISAGNIRGTRGNNISVGGTTTGKGDRIQLNGNPFEPSIIFMDFLETTKKAEILYDENFGLNGLILRNLEGSEATINLNPDGKVYIDNNPLVVGVITFNNYYSIANKSLFFNIGTNKLAFKDENGISHDLY